MDQRNPSIKRALNIAGGGKPGRGVRLRFPIDLKLSSSLKVLDSERLPKAPPWVRVLGLVLRFRYDCAVALSGRMKCVSGSARHTVPVTEERSRRHSTWSLGTTNFPSPDRVMPPPTPDTVAAKVQTQFSAGAASSARH